jgi:tRNA U34 2-thiouridine synthase MnmA/TrmU
MELLCVDASIIVSKLDKDKTHEHTGEGLKEGQIYTTNGKIFEYKHGLMCYYIEGLGIKLACRFTEVLKEETLYVKLENLSLK